MKIFFSILLNIITLILITYLLGENSEKGISAGITVAGGWKAYVVGGVILGIINAFVRPVLKILSLPLLIIFFPLASFAVNAGILGLFDFIINQVLAIPGVAYNINGWINFIIAVAIFGILNMVYSFLFLKK